ncbi:MAG: glycosyltransferase involved in cell wall biosynthesis, partial [Marinoscillum sp.]
AIAARRLGAALVDQGVEVSYGYFYPEQQSNGRIIGSGFLNKIKFAIDRLKVFRLVKYSSGLYKFSNGTGAKSLFSTDAFKEADLVHIHWVHFGFLGVEEIVRISTAKPTIWTMHDMWSFTGGCHYSDDCAKYISNCDGCFYLKDSSKVSFNLLSQKEEVWKSLTLKLVACSQWLAARAHQSHLFKAQEISVIGNTLDLNVFKPLEQTEIRSRLGLKLDSFYVLCGAMDLNDERKGFNYLIKSLELLMNNGLDFKLLLFGSNAVQVDGIECVSLGHLANEVDIVNAYNAADIFVLPSIQDNLPNTVLEAMACGVPVVTFDSGGVIDMVDHKQNGFIATNKDSKSLSEGITYFSDKSIRKKAGINARETIASHFNEALIANKYISIYKNQLDR